MKKASKRAEYTAFVYNPAGSSDPALAIAACRAGAVGVFDAHGLAESETMAAVIRLRQFTSSAFGLRCADVDAGNRLERCVEAAGDQLEWLIVDADTARAHGDALAAARSGNIRVLVETSAWDDATAALSDDIDGWILRGAECASSAPDAAGRTGTLSLVTRALGAGASPVYACGGIGPITAPAVLAAGCSGFVIADQALALREACGASPSNSVDGKRASAWAERYVNAAGALRALAKAIRRAAHLDYSEAVTGAALPSVVQRLPVGTTAPPDFQAAVARAGGLPLVNANSISEALATPGLPWAAILDGGLSTSALHEQVARCAETGAAAALLSDGRADQALALSSAAIPVYFQVSSPAMLRALIAQGARRFLLHADDDGALPSLSQLETLGETLIASARVHRGLSVWLAGIANHGVPAAALACVSALFDHHRIETSLVVDEAYLKTREFRAPVPDGDGYTVAALHHVLCAKARKTAATTLARMAKSGPSRKRRRKSCDVAIVGIGGIFPGANSTREFWENVLNKVDAIQEIPGDRWDWRLYFDEDREAADKIYSRWGGFLDALPFDPMKLGMPPNAVRAVDPLQLMALEVIRRTLDDAGYGLRDFDRERASIIVGASGGIGDVGAQYALRAETARFAGELEPALAARLPAWTEDSFAGILLNVAAGRAANRLDFGGVNYAVDSACASSLTAVYQAVGELETGRSDVVIAGGIDTVQGPFGYLCFSKTQALSPRGRCSTFDTSADGIVISEGIAMVMLKRLADAERDGDRIYAVIKGAGGSSDGRARSMTAPHPAGQIRALQRCYGQAGYSPATVGLIEAHGTGTVAGDTAELQTVTRLLKASGAASNQTAIGSVKTLIGHTKATAGIAGLVKTCLALYHKVLPPHANVSNPSPSIASTDSPLYLVSDAIPWPASTDHPRRAGVSAFGFGGTNFHVAMEEYQGELVAGSRPAVMDTWQSELLVWRAADRARLIERICAVQNQLDRGALPCLRDLAYSLAHALPATGETAAIVVRPQDPLANRLGLLIAHLRNPRAEPLPPQAFYSSNPLGEDGKVAVVFAGQGSQYPNMMRELALLFPAFRQVVETADAVLRDPVEASAGSGVRLSRLIYPGGLYGEKAQQQATDALTRTDIAQPAIGVVEAGLWAVMQQMGFSADMAAGHSYGEYAALYAAGAFDLPTLLELSSARGRYIVQACEGKDMGLMAAARAPREQVEAVAARFDDLLVANHNSPQQSILSGSRESITSAVQDLQDADIDAVALPVGAAFHSSFVAPAQALLAEKLFSTDFHAPAFPVYSNTTAAPHSDDVDVLKQTLSEHLARPVEFVAEIEAMYAAGARVFVGLGPKNFQSSMVDQILGDRPHCVARIDDQAGGLRGLLCGAGALLAENVPLHLAPLFEGRDCRLIDLDRLAGESRQVTLPSHIWMLTGSGARRITDPPLSPMTLEEAQASIPDDATQIRKSEEPAASKHEDAAATAQSEARAFAGSIAVPPTPATEAPTPAPARVQAPRSAALLNYQATMRAFVSGNERVIAQAMGIRGPAEARHPAGATAAGNSDDARARPARTIATRPGQQVPPASTTVMATPPASPAPTATASDGAASAHGMAADAGPLPRFVIRPQAESVDGIALAPLAAGAWLIIQDSHGIALHLKGLMERETGVKPVLIDASDVGNDAALSRHIEAARRTEGGLRGVLHLAAVDVKPLASGAPLDQWRDQARHAEKCLFRLLRAGADDLAGDDATILAASGLGGLMGRQLTLAGLTNSGGASGLLKCVNEEWQTGRIKAVDLDPSQPADSNAAHLLTELKLPGGRIEVGYRDGRRYVFRTAESAFKPGQSRALRIPDDSWVVLASGGARGITAELLRDLATAGATLVVTGRTPEPEPEDDATCRLETDADLRAHFIRAARNAGEEVRPVAVQRQVGRLRNRREMAANLADLRAAGARIDYRVCDMADADATAALFAGIYRDYGRLDGVVHGAGIIEDKLLVDKTDESWFRVFDIKADSAFLLSRHLRPDSLRFVVLFTSVAGRYGNSGQTDYAAANEVVNRAAWALQQRYGDSVKVCAINWGPWAATTHGQGMVSAAAERKFADRGVRLVYPRAGRELFMHEITTAPTDEVEVIAGEGPWEQVECDNGLIAEGTAVATPVAPAHRPLLAHAEFSIGAKDTRIATRLVRRSTDLYLDQHLINEVPVMPAAVAVEMMAQAALSFCPNYVITEMSDIRLLNGIRFTQDAVGIRIVASLGVADAGDGRIAVEIALYPDGAKGRPSYRATAHLNGTPLKCPIYQPLIKAGGSPLTAHDAYRRVLFHGPCLQNIADLRGLDRQGAVAGLIPTPPMALWLSEPTERAQWLFDPGCLDAAAQMGVVYGNVLNGESALPNSFARVRRFGDGPMPACNMYFLAHPEQPEHRIRADVAFVDSDSRLRLFVEQLECTSSEALNSISGGWKGRICV